MYGLVQGSHLWDMVAEVCEVLGYGKHGTAKELLLGTLAQETHMGQYKDPTAFSAGMGIAQFDKMPFMDVRDRTSEKTRQRCLAAWDIDVKKVTWEELNYNSFLSVIFMRLKYKLVPDEIPAELEGIALYYKKWYNSYAGKATPEEFIENYNRFVVLKL